MNPSSCSPLTAAAARPVIAPARGFSLVELMVAMAIGLILMTILATVFANSSRSQKEITMSAQQVENGRYSIELLSDDLRHAGYYGYYVPAGSPPGTLPDPCDSSLTVANVKTHLILPVQGYDSPGSTPLSSCINAANFVAGTDVLVVRRASSTYTCDPTVHAEDTAKGQAGMALVAARLYIQTLPSTTNTFNPIVALGSPSSAFTNFTDLPKVRGLLAGTPDFCDTNVVPSPIRQLVTHIYYVSPCSNRANGSTCASSDDGGSPIPTLYRMELRSGTYITSSDNYPLVEGVENFQVEYGLDSDADGSPNSAYVTDPGATTNWRNLMAVRMYVLARNTQVSPGYLDTKTYNLGGTVPPIANDGYRRHVYDTLVRLKNPSERKETP